MKMQNSIKIKLYLNSRKRPFTIELDNDKQIEELIEKVLTKEIVRFGLLSFRAEDFRYIIEV